MSKNKFIFEEDLEKIERKNRPLFVEMDYVEQDENSKSLMDNPFTYNFKTSKINVCSIEDFGLVYKKRNIYLRSIIRNPNISKWKKKRILKKYLSRNKKDFYKQVKNLNMLNANSEDEFERVKFVRDKLWVKLVVFLGILISFILLILFNPLYFIFGDSNIINNNSGFIFDLSHTLSNLIKESNIVFILALGLLFIDLVFFVYLFYTKIKKNRYFKHEKNYYKMIRYNFRSYNKKFKKLYPRIKSYYLKQIKKSSKNYRYLDFKALDLNDLWNQQYDFIEIAKEADNIINETAKIIKYQKKHILIKKCLYVLILSIVVILLVYTVVHGIIKI